MHHSDDVVQMLGGVGSSADCIVGCDGHAIPAVTATSHDAHDVIRMDVC